MAVFSVVVQKTRTVVYVFIRRSFKLDFRAEMDGMEGRPMYPGNESSDVLSQYNLYMYCC